MRFKNLNTERIVLLLSMLFVATLGINDELNLYIHPRYIGFTVTFAIIGLVVLLVGQNQQSHDKDNDSKASLLAVTIILLTAFLFPARTLSSATVSQRTIDSGSLVSSSSSQSTSTLFSGSSKGLKLFDWANLIQTNTDPAYYANKPVEVTGFVYDADLGKDTIWLANFVVTCCAVDAQPVGVPVQIDNWQSDYNEDQWLEIEGEFLQNDSGDNARIELKPSKVTEIERPQNPYGE